MRTCSNRTASLARDLIVAAIKFYRILFSPLMIHACRFRPSCSVYAIEAMERQGLLKGFWLIVKRIARCQPFCRGGFDPVQ